MRKKSGGRRRFFSLKIGRLQKGFTIIEVVIVLAIAGLIFLIVFLAVPAIQRSVRDTQRKQDIVLLKAAIESWRANNKGNNLDTAAELAQISANYFDARDPTTGAPYVLTFMDGGGPHVAIGAEPPIGTVFYHVGHICGDDGGNTTYTTNHATGYLHSRRIYAILTSLETPNLVYCVDIITEN
jgi:prepilin-type N-terminal cleavage/methylation domain-containing protein